MRKEVQLTVLLVVLAAVYVFCFTDWFRSKPILIHHMTRPPGYLMRQRAKEPVNQPPFITFGFERTYQLTEVLVVPVAALQTNEHPVPLWHLVSESNSAPCGDFHYGQRIRGMHPAVAGAHPDPLDPDAVYRLIVKAGRTQGQHDFRINSQGAPPAAAPEAGK